MRGLGVWNLILTSVPLLHRIKILQIVDRQHSAHSERGEGTTMSEYVSNSGRSELAVAGLFSDSEACE